MERFDGTSLEAMGRRLEVARRVYRLSQVEFCTAVHISPTAYNSYEKGRKRPVIENAIALCERYDLTLDWIYRGDPSGLRKPLRDAIKKILELEPPLSKSLFQS